MAKKDTTSIGFEDKIWKAADVLRGNLNASEYEGVVLGLIFLKYISDKFEEKFSELSADEYADEEDKDEYTADNVFFVPKNARWSVISAAAHTPQVGTAIDDAMLAIEQENPRLKGILPKNFARPELDKRRLGDVVDLFFQHSDALVSRRERPAGPHLRILPSEVRFDGGQERWRILHPKLHCAHHRGDSPALRRACLRPLLWVGWHVCAECQIHQQPSEGFEPHQHLWPGG